MSLLDNELYGLHADKQKEIDEYLDNFIGMEYGIWPFSKKIKTHADVLKFFSKYPEFNQKLIDIEDKYSYIEDIIRSEHIRINR